MKKIQLLTAASDDAGGFRDGGSVLSVGPKGDVSAERAAELVAAGRAEEYKGEAQAAPAEVPAADGEGN